MLSRPMDNLHWSNRLVCRFGWYVGKLNLLVGIAALGLAGAILAVSGRNRSENHYSKSNYERDSRKTSA